MATSIIRCRTMITRALDRTRWEEIADGAVLQEDGVILETGTYEDLSRRFPTLSVLGSGHEVMLPGFVNAHHHTGLTPVQLGSPDMPLELWFATRMVARAVDPYLDTLYSAFEMIQSGITTVQHIDGWYSGTLEESAARSEAVLKAYDDIGMRVSYSFSMRDQNRLVYKDDDKFAARLPQALRDDMRAWFARNTFPLDDQLDLFRHLFNSYEGQARTRIQLSPANLHWCSDQALGAVSELASAYGVPVHMHLLETQYQREYARRRSGGTALEHIDRLGLLGPHLTIGHGVWLSETDIERIGETRTCICHNCSSNFRLRSGIAPLNRFETCGINTAIGLDEAGLNDDQDMLQEMRLVLRAHRAPGLEDADVPQMAQILRMATRGGARTTPYGDQIGTLEAGRAADLSLVDWRQISYPYLDRETPVLDAVIQRAKTEGMKLVMCNGTVIYEHGSFPLVDRHSALTALHDSLGKTLTAEDLEQRLFAKDLLGHVKKFYAGYLKD
jgi:5-methylthioadenosine/S-adenosylhomocysteine deaminase